MGLGERIAEAIKGSGKTKAQVARECEVTSGAVSQWLSGNVKSLKAETAMALEAATGYRATWLLHGKGAKTRAEPSIIWPFPKLPIERFMHLDDRDQAYVERRLIQAVEECEAFLNPQGFSQMAEESALTQSRVATRRKDRETPQNDKDTSAAHPLETLSGRGMGPALKQALDVQGSSKRETGSHKGIPKQGPRRRA
jgi:transcriptional regulator with XRE-family HTH domain